MVNTISASGDTARQQLLDAAIEYTLHRPRARFWRPIGPGPRGRKLNPGRQALLVLAYLKKGEAFSQLAAGFAIAPLRSFPAPLVPVIAQVGSELGPH
jgi:hypothetical protein